jgi:ribosomal protein S18 acetylase RimI-like enzyme
MLALAASWREAGANAPSPALVAKYVTGFGRAGDAGVVAIRAGAAVGAAWYRRLPAGDRGFGYVSDDIPELSVAVRPEARRRGIGAGLLGRLLDQARAAGLSGVSLSVEPANPARLLYERLGFVKVGEVDGSATLLKTLRADQPDGVTR